MLYIPCDPSVLFCSKSKPSYHFIHKYFSITSKRELLKKKKSTCDHITVITLKIEQLDFPGGPVVKTLSFLCRGLRLDPWGTKILYATPLSQKKGRTVSYHNMPSWCPNLRLSWDSHDIFLVSLKRDLNNVRTLQVVKASPVSLPTGGSRSCLPSLLMELIS